MEKVIYSQDNYPKVVIVGKPNVGKSSLFNALLGRQKSLVAREAGVTRDLVEGYYKDPTQDLYFHLIDTGGISYTIEHQFIEDTVLFAKKAIASADILLFVVDGTTELTHDDQVILDMIRRDYIHKTILLVNKIDHEQRKYEAYEFYQLGFDDTLFTSAAHRSGLGELKEVIAQRLEEKSPSLKKNSVKMDSEVIKCVLLGKPNVGKSSFFNYLLKEEKAIVSDIPGTTRDVLSGNFNYKGRNIEILDIAGFRRKNKIDIDLEKDTVKKGLWAIRHQDIVLVLIDGSDKVTEQDKKLVELVMKEKKAMVIGLTKWDLIFDGYKEHQDQILDQFAYQLKLASFVPIIPFSVKTGESVNQFLNKVLKVWSNYNQRILPRDVTLFLKELVKKKPPFSKLGILKVYYGVQIQNKPPHFQIFVNNELIITDSYKRFLINSLYQEYSLAGIPITLSFKNRR